MFDIKDLSQEEQDAIAQIIFAMRRAYMDKEINKKMSYKLKNGMALCFELLGNMIEILYCSDCANDKPKGTIYWISEEPATEVIDFTKDNSIKEEEQ